MLSQHASLPRLLRAAGLIIATFAAVVLAVDAGVLLYDTGFESSASETPGFATGVGTASAPKLVGSDGWTMVANPAPVAPGTIATWYPFAGIDSGLVTGMGQTAALGCLDHVNFSMPPNTTQFIRVGRKVATEPVLAGNLPIIDFYCQLGLTQSTNSRHDDFELLVYNWDDKVLGGLTFDLTQNKLFRYDANEYNSGSADPPYTDTGLSLASLYGTVVEVTMRVNYKTNTWTATVGGVQVVGGATFTRRPTTGSSPAARTFGSLQARWYIATVGYPGNNWMLFDDWSITASAEPTIPATASANYAANSTAAITVTDTDSVGWTVTSDQSWALVSPASGTGNGTVTVTCAPNAAASARSAVISVGTQTCVMTQAASPYALWATALTEGTRDFAQDADHDGVGNGMEYALGRNALGSSGNNGLSQLPLVTTAGSAASRNLTMTLSLPQPAPADLIYDIQAANDLTGSWTVIMEKIGPGPWTAPGNSGATVLSSPDGSGRTSYAITDAQGHHFMRLAVTTTSVAASVTTLPAAASALHAANSTAAIQVTSNTAWAAASGQSWAVVSPASGFGNGTVTVTCGANATATPRSAVIRVGGQTCLLTQAAWPYAVWAAGLTEGGRGFVQDADHDGVSNGIEYALGRNAATSSGSNGSAQLPVITTAGSAPLQNLTMSVNLPDLAPVDIVYDVQVTNNLTDPWTVIAEKNGTGPWTALGNSGASVSSSPAGSGRTTYTITDVQGHHFMRLAVKSL